jgi:Flp pilus assembly protein TadG
MTGTRLLRSRKGATLVELALVAPIFILMVFGLIEFGRAYWTRQTLQEVAYQTARCMALDSQCATETQRRSFAVNRAQDYAITIAAANVTVRSGVTCRTRPNSHEAAITIAFQSALQGFGLMPQTLTVRSCFPVLA